MYDITCHISGFHSCVWALYSNLYTAFSICNFCSFCKNRRCRWGPLNLLFDSFSLTWRILQFFVDFTKFAIFAVFAKIAVLVGALSTPSSTGFHWLDEPSNFSQILQFSQFLQNHSSCRGPLNPFFYWFSLTQRIFQFFADFTIFAIFAVFAKIAALVGALSTSSSTGFHWLDEFSNFSQILEFSQLRANLDIPH